MQAWSTKSISAHLIRLGPEFGERNGKSGHQLGLFWSNQQLWLVSPVTDEWMLNMQQKCHYKKKHRSNIAYLLDKRWMAKVSRKS